MSTNLGSQIPGANVEPYLTNSTYNQTNGEGQYILIRCTVANLPTGAGYAVGCLAQASDTGNNYVNTGTTSAASFVRLDAGSSFVLPTSATDASTTTGNSLAVTESTLTTGNAEIITANALTTGTIYNATASSAVLTTGNYFAANDGGVTAWAIARNGHMITAQSIAPTIAVTTQAGISAAAITAGATDTNGIITTTGTSTGSTLLTVSFNQAFATAPKTVIITPANAAAAMPNTGYYCNGTTTTAFTITVAAGGTYAATPSLRYTVIG